MDKEQLIEKTVEYVKRSMEGGDVGHDWFHVERVWKMAKRICLEEKADMFIVEMAALLHDIADWKFHEEGKAETTAMMWMKTIGVRKEDIKNVVHIIENISFKGSGEKERMSTLEGKIVQDADRLDAMGAIGIARAFTFAGYKNIPIFVPGVDVRENLTFERYKETEKSAVNHFYEKLLLLKDRMNTKTGKEIAEQRHKHMEEYLEEFFKEMGGER